MIRTYLFCFFLGVSTLLLSAPSIGGTIWHWEDEFSPQEKQKLERWVNETVEAVETYSGSYPFDVHIFFHRREPASEPVPWANTQRTEKQGVHLHIDPKYPLEAFLQDWTAPHELSHLLIPYLGKDLRWFAEGFASYMQYQIMMQMDTHSSHDMRDKYMQRLKKAKQRYKMNEMPFVEAAPMLFEQRLYPVMYWGGASYFLKVNRLLQAKGSSLKNVLMNYLECCRMQNDNFDDLILRLDALSESTVFSEQLRIYSTKPGFPEYESLFN